MWSKDLYICNQNLKIKRVYEYKIKMIINLAFRLPLNKNIKGRWLT